jgi:mannose-6-phosphate isomerase-like protein (cupin superfamily)
MKGFVKDIESLAVKNEDFRQVLYTAKHCQLVVMALKPKEDIGAEVHKLDQFFRVEEGSGEAVLDDVRTEIRAGFAIVVPAGTKHNIINTGKVPLKLYTLYAPPNHTLEAEVNAGRLAKTLNVDVEELEAMEGAVKRVGGSVEGMDSSLKGLNSRLAMIAIHGPRSKMALQIFAGMGISEVALKGKDATQVMGLLAEKMQGMAGAKAMALGERLGLDEGTVRLLQKGKEGMEALTSAVKKHVASAEQVEAAEKFEQSMLDIKGALAATGRELMTYLMPALQGMASALAKVAQWVRDHSEVVKAGILAIAAAFLAVNAAAIVTAIQAAITWVAMLGPLDLIPIAIALVAAGLYLLTTHIKEVGHFFNWLALEVVFQLLKAFFTVEHAAAKMWKGIKDSAMAPLNWIWEKLKAIIDIAKQEGNFFKAIFHGDVKGAVSAVKAAVGDVGSVTGLTPATTGGPAWGAAPVQARPSVSAGMALRPSSISNTRSTSTSTSHRETHIGQITVQTQATDAQGIAGAIGGAVKYHGLVDQVDGGF